MHGGRRVFLVDISDTMYAECKVEDSFCRIILFFSGRLSSVSCAQPWLSAGPGSNTRAESTWHGALYFYQLDTNRVFTLSGLVCLCLICNITSLSMGCRETRIDFCPSGSAYIHLVQRYFLGWYGCFSCLL